MMKYSLISKKGNLIIRIIMPNLILELKLEGKSF